ncbi:MAG: prepilin-type N-terminal cleavage/methylation domain-containing protein [Methylacidiphilales bacterium]|nr:prepilin-type N-terminal cleavage/methylation domain-containing protein [Candidatus Methylacidiphilales bacterium]MDW8349360.1 prepilin-type N-terminal cleavage/methylation domain-containing protein [Verrucomicrobiae bacterium]
MSLPKISLTRQKAGFTLIELLVAMAVVGLLAGIIAGIAPLALEKGKRSRAQAEIAALELALQSYKDEQGDYPEASVPQAGEAYTTETSAYISAGNILYGALRGGDPNIPPQATPSSPSIPVYYQAKLNHVSSTPPYHFIDPYRRPYGYSSLTQARFNQGLYDLWSLGSKPENVHQWIKNWTGN